MRQEFTNISNVFDNTRFLSTSSFINNTENLISNEHGRKAKVIRYSAQLTSLLALLPKEHPTSVSSKKEPKNINEYSKSIGPLIIKPISHENMSANEPMINTQSINLPIDTIADDCLTDDYLTIIGELIHDLYQLHVKNYPSDINIKNNHKNKNKKIVSIYKK